MTESSANELHDAAKGLSAVYVNCSLKLKNQESHTAKLMAASSNIIEKAGGVVRNIHMLDHDIAYGVQPDMTEHGWDKDDWPKLWEVIKEADIVVVGTPIWLGEESSVCRLLIERLYAMSGELNDKGQSIFYGKTCGVVVTGNEDGIKHCAMTILYAMQHLGFSVPPQADCGWIGEAGPGPSYGDEQEDRGAVGFENDFTQRNTTIMTWNMIHTAQQLSEAGGLPNYGNDRRGWSDGERYGFENPEYRS